MVGLFQTTSPKCLEAKPRYWGVSTKGVSTFWVCLVYVWK